MQAGSPQAPHPGYYGDCYTWIALDTVSKAIVACRVATGSWNDRCAFGADLRDRLTQQVQIASDGYARYAPTIRAVVAHAPSSAKVPAQSYSGQPDKSESLDERRHGKTPVSAMVMCATSPR